MSTTLYVEQENGNLKLVAEVDGIENAALAVDALLDEMPRLKDREFVAVSGDLDEGSVSRVVVESDEPVNPRRTIRVSGSVAAEVAPKPARRKPARKAAPEPVEEKAAPKPRRQARKAAPKKAAPKPKAAAKPKPKAAAKPKPKPRSKPAPKKGGSPFNRSTKGDD